MLVPLYGFLQGDTLGLLVLVHDYQTVRDVAAVLEQAASVRVAPHPGRLHVYVHTRRLDASLTVAAAGLAAFDRVDVIPEPV